MDHNGVDKRSQGEADRDRALRSRSRSDGGKAGDAVMETCPKRPTGRRSGQLGAQGRQCFKEDIECSREVEQQRARETELCRGHD